MQSARQVPSVDPRSEETMLVDGAYILSSWKPDSELTCAFHANFQGDDLMQDKQIEDITALMTSAIREDINLNNEKKPAIKKTLLLPKVMQVMQKWDAWYYWMVGNLRLNIHLANSASLQDSLLENSEFLSELTGFIEPLKDGSLPSLTIQRSILSQLNKVSERLYRDRIERGIWLWSRCIHQFDVIDKDMLKASGLGKIVNFYTRTKRVQPEITRQANQLIDKWSKPILRAAGIASGSATGRMAATGHAEEESYGPGEGSGVITISAKQLREKEDLMQYALEAQREVVEERKGSRRPNVIVSTLDIYDLTGGMHLDNDRLIDVRATLTPKRPPHDGSRGATRSRRGRTLVYDS
jgi:hypothetical protein